eukprot:scaffold11177_cov20-Tisochrysis_lutea.AAC.1
MSRPLLATGMASRSPSCPTLFLTLLHPPPLRTSLAARPPHRQVAGLGCYRPLPVALEAKLAVFVLLSIMAPDSVLCQLAQAGCLLCWACCHESSCWVLCSPPDMRHWCKTEPKSKSCHQALPCPACLLACLRAYLQALNARAALAPPPGHQALQHARTTGEASATSEAVPPVSCDMNSRTGRLRRIHLEDGGVAGLE